MQSFIADDEFEDVWFMIYVDMLAFNYGYSYEYVCELDAMLFLKLIRCIQKREAENTLMQAHVVAMANADQEAWDNFKVSLGFAPAISDLALAVQNNNQDDSTELERLKAFIGA